MSAQNVHAHEDRLLDFAYGELPASEAQLLEQHVQGCARCSKALADIRGVRFTMSQLSAESAPDAGLESLLAYAQQSARRAAAGPEPKPSRWRRWLLPAVGLATVSTFGILTLTVNENLELTPNLSQKAPAAAKAAPPSSLAPERPGPLAAAPAPAGVPMAEEDADALSAAAAPRTQVAERDRAEPARKSMRAQESKGSTAAARPADWANAGGGGALLEKRMEAPSKKASKALDMEEFEALEQAPVVARKQEERLSAEASVKDAPTSRSKSAGYLGAASGAVADKPVAAKNDSLRVGGGTGYGRGLATDESDDAVEGAPAGPPPPAVASAPVLQAEPMTPPAAAPREEQPSASAGGSAPRKEAVARAEAAKPKTAESKVSSGTTLTARDLAAQAQSALEQGDRAREAVLLRAALSVGAGGEERLSLLSRLCESVSAQGRAQEASEVCGRIVTEFPGSSAAQLAQRRMRQVAPPAAPAQAPVRAQ
jgi:hypothetical protein